VSAGGIRSHCTCEDRTVRGLSRERYIIGTRRERTGKQQRSRAQPWQGPLPQGISRRGQYREGSPERSGARYRSGPPAHHTDRAAPRRRKKKQGSVTRLPANRASTLGPASFATTTCTHPERAYSRRGDLRQRTKSSGLACSEVCTIFAPGRLFRTSARRFDRADRPVSPHSDIASRTLTLPFSCKRAWRRRMRPLEGGRAWSWPTPGATRPALAVDIRDIRSG